jgi:hypothetical protein
MSKLWKTSGGVLILTLALFAAENPFVGTWKLNAAESNLEGSGLGPAATVHIESDGAGLKVSVETTVRGQPNNFTYQATFDGKPNKVPGNPAMDEISTQRINARSFTLRVKKAEAIVFTERYSLSGKTLTISRFGQSPEDGTKRYSATLVFDKQ